MTEGASPVRNVRLVEALKLLFGDIDIVKAEALTRQEDNMTKETETEADRLARLLAKCPSIAKAFASEQVTFDDQAEPTDDDILFLTRVTDSPVQIKGRLAPDGVWRISSYHIPVVDSEAAEAAIAREADDEMLVLVDGIGEAMVRYAIPKILANLAPSEARETFMRRLTTSRFAVTIH